MTACTSACPLMASVVSRDAVSTFCVRWSSKIEHDQDGSVAGHVFGKQLDGIVVIVMVDVVIVLTPDLLAVSNDGMFLCFVHCHLPICASYLTGRHSRLSAVIRRNCPCLLRWPKSQAGSALGRF